MATKSQEDRFELLLLRSRKLMVHKSWGKITEYYEIKER